MSGPAPSIQVREATPGDLARIVEFNRRLASETESKVLDHAVLEQGVLAALADPDRLRYWVACAPPGGEAVGQAAVTREWSDWRNGWLWWFQSVYVESSWRNRGVFRALHSQIRETARSAGNVVGLRLYVEQENHRALRAYLALGMSAGGYDVLEEIWPDRFGRTS